MLRAILLIISGFAAMIVVGTVLLSLPIATVGEPLSAVDALFTSTSAVCVTGLIVVDTATHFTFFGQVVIITLCQLGGLGLITFAALVLLFLGRRISLIQREVVSTTHGGAEFRIDIRKIAKPVLLYLLISEGIGAFLLFFAFVRHFPWHKALFHAVFHSISAFCNAGFSTFSDSMVQFSGDWLVMLPMIALIVLGGLGFIVAFDLKETIYRGKPVTLHTKLVLAASLVLIVLGALFFFIMESGNVLEGRSLDEKVLASFFHSATTRTAGFNSVEYGGLTNGTLSLTIILMIIGGSPGSTAGGIKTTTAAIIFLTALARVRGRQDTEFAKRAIARRSVTDAVTLAALAVIFVLFVTLMLQITELGSVPHEKAEGAFAKLAFEGVSAFGTVGLSLGATAELTAAGKLLIVATMFIGRLGPLTFFYLLGSIRPMKQYRLYSETVMVG